MEQKIYKVERGDTLEKISEKTGFYMEEIRQWHNLRCENVKDLIEYGGRLPKEILLPMHAPKTFYKNIEPNPHEKLVMRTPEENEKAFLKNLVFGEETKYRCEQMVITKINGIPINTAETKREFVIKKAQNLQNFIVQVLITDNIINISPAQYQEAINLVAELDYVKCNNLIIRVNPDTGQIDKILNMHNIISLWKGHKNKLLDNNVFIKNEKARQALNQFIDLAEKQITIEQNLIEDLKSKMFFEVYFSKYLINSKDKYEPYQRTFYSQLFDGVKFNLNINQEIVRESKEGTIVRKTSSIQKIDLEKIKETYNRKYKPMIQYKFSEYRVGYNEQSLFDEQKNSLIESQISIFEEVKNNIQIFVNYSLKKIES